MAKILLIDDDEKLAQEVAEQLTRAGHTCMVEKTGKQGLELADPKAFDLLILDVMLPDLSGFEVCRRIRSNPDSYKLPILFLSAMNAQEEVSHGLAQGADDYVTKPFRMEILLSRVMNLLSILEHSPLKDSATGCFSPKGMRLEIQKAINLHQNFALMYVEVLGMAEFGRKYGNENRLKLNRHMARGLELIADRMSLPDTVIGHMGGGHYLCAIDAEQVTPFSQQVRQLWSNHIHAFYKSLGQEKLFQDPKLHHEGAIPAVDLLICITVRSPRGKENAQQLLDILNHLRQCAHQERKAGVRIDRRR